MQSRYEDLQHHARGDGVPPSLLTRQADHVLREKSDYDLHTSEMRTRLFRIRMTTRTMT